MITKDKVTEIFCIIDEFDKNFESELKKNLLPVTDGKQHRNRKASLSDSGVSPTFRTKVTLSQVWVAALY